MPQVEFYTLEPGSPGDRYLLACHLVADLYREGLRVLIQCPDAAAARHLDRLLWTFRQAAFIPHGELARSDAALTPILIRHDDTPTDHGEVLVNLAPRPPADFTRFARICEPVDQDPGTRTAARERFRWYREQGFPPVHHPTRLPRSEPDGA